MIPCLYLLLFSERFGGLLSLFASAPEMLLRSLPVIEFRNVVCLSN